MKDLKKITSAFIIVLCLCMTANVYSQQEDHKNGYNTALSHFEDQDYAGAINVLNSFMTSMEEEPSAWIEPGEEYVEFIYKVYRLAATSYKDGGDDESAEVIFDNLLFVFTDYFYESDIISRYNDTDIFAGY